jgi:hypothetical protein
LLAQQTLLGNAQRFYEPTVPPLVHCAKGESARVHDVMGNEQAGCPFASAWRVGDGQDRGA